ncbi:universal stress protein [Pontibacillus yanchengensis]|nr:universal stress protein [Pontibacillus yanchengensis]
MKCLVAYDGSELSRKALEQAMYQKHDDAPMEVHIVTVVSPNGPYTNPGLYQSIENSLMEKAKAELDSIVEEIQDIYNVTIKIEVLTGNPGNNIAKYAKEHDIEMIIIGSRGLGNVRGFFLGSVSHRVVQQADCQVMIVK